MKKKHKLLSALLIGTMALSMAACGKSSENTAAGSNTQSPKDISDTNTTSNAADDFQYPMEAITLTFNGTADGGYEYYDDSQHPQWSQDLYYHKVMRDKTGVTLKDTGGQSNATTLSDSFLLMLASGELPDLIVAPWTAYTGGADAAIDDGYVIDLMEYSEYIPNLLKYLNEHPEIAAQVFTDDGRLAYAPFIKDDPITNSGLVIRKDWLDELNLEAPTTIDELHDVLVAFKEHYNCKAPLTFEARWLFLQGAATPISSAWITTYTDYVLDGKVQFGPLTPEYKEFVQTLASWYAEGLLDPDFASVDKATVQAKFSNGESGVSIQQELNVENCINANAGTEYAVIPLTSMVMNKGDEPQFSWQSILKFDGGFCWSVSTSCSDIEAACRYLDWRFSEEGMMTMNYGIEGVTYNIVDGQVQLTDLVMHNEETPSSYTARDEIAWVQNRAGISLDIAAAYSEAGKNCVETWTAHMDEYQLPTLSYTAEQQEIISDSWGDVNDYCQEKILKYVIGSENMETWDSFVDSIKQMGAEKVLAAKQEAYDSYLKKVESFK
ncbi:MAG: hypothetical protein ACI4AB_00925 [Acetatifactor sp.]